jgi:rod shape-determining protein MreC
LAPLQSGVTRVSRGIGGLATGVGRLTHLSRENTQLRRQVEQLNQERTELLEAKRENEGLRRILQLEKDTRHQVQVAEVIARTPSNWFNTITISKGSTSGISKGMAVITPEGVVGHIRSVTPHSADVLLITDPKSALGGRVFRTSQVTLVEGLGDPGGGTALVKPLSNEADIKKDDYIVTSGLSEIYPKGLPVGVIEEVREGRYGLTKYGVLRPAVDFGRLEWVAVVTRRNAQLGGGTISAGP